VTSGETSDMASDVAIGPATRQRVWLALGLDVLAVLVFVAIGRRNHDEGNSIGDLFETAAPFLVGLGVGWVVVRAWRRPTKIRTGVMIWPIVVLVGMIVRNLAFDRGTATAFVIVTTLFLGACFVGWRAIFRSVTAR
jgi:hypothetical protein